MRSVLNEVLAEAIQCFHASDLVGAERACRKVLKRAPDHPGALHLLGVVKLAGDDPGQAAKLIGSAAKHAPDDSLMQENLGLALLVAGDGFRAEPALRRAIALGAGHAPVHMRLGLALSAQGRFAEAEAAIRTALNLAPRDADCQIHLGNVLAEQGREQEAMLCYEQVLARDPGHIDAHYNLGTLFRRQGRLEDAAMRYEKVLALNANHADTHNNLGVVRERQERLPEALAHYRRALALNPRHTAAMNNIGNLLRRERRFEEAATALDRALALEPNNVDACINLGNVRADQGRFEEAREWFERAQRLNPAIYEAHHNLGLLFEREGRWSEALNCYRRALAIAPTRADAHTSLAGLLREGGQLDEAVHHYRQAIEHDPLHAAAWYHLGETCKLAGKFDEATECYDRALALEPQDSRALGSLVHMRQNTCDWNGIEGLWERVHQAVAGGRASLSPFSALSMPTSTAEQLEIASAWATARFSLYSAGRAPLGFDFSARPRRERLRVGYLSWDFHQHATAYLMAELLDLHDRRRFEVIAYSYGPDDGSAIRKRIRNACERFVDITGESHLAAAQRIYRDEVDILVDLKGYTIGARTPIVALRPAPVQLNWLGYPGTMGMDCIDYIIADPFLIPPEMACFYREKVVRLPHCYQVNDRKREVSEHTPTRAACGLPDRGFVFACFNQTYKILPDVFALWMRLLNAVPDSTLWLLETNRWAVANLRQAAAAAGVAPERLVFAPRKPMPEHLARYRLADLAVDTFPYTSHTTASDALWAGCPLVTCAGETFASRVAGSILISAGLGELVTHSFGNYERVAIELARSPERLRSLRQRLAAARGACPLFDTPRFVSDLERAYQEMFDAWRQSSA